MPIFTCPPRIRVAVAWGLIALLVALSAEAVSSKRVLILHSFGRDFAPYDVITSEEIFSTLMGEQVEPRRAFIESNALGVRNLDV